jgi:hypothetical protein
LLGTLHCYRRNGRREQRIAQKQPEGCCLDFKYILVLCLMPSVGQGRRAEEMHMHIAVCGAQLFREGRGAVRPGYHHRGFCAQRATPVLPTPCTKAKKVRPIATTPVKTSTTLG